MRFVVVGGRGFIGSHVAAALSSGSNPVLVVDPTEGSPAKGEASIAHVKGVLPYEEMRKLLQPGDVVIWAAGATVPLSANEDVRNELANNLVPVVEAAQASADAGVAQFVFISSGGAIYKDNPRGGSHDETSELDPVSAYGVGKIASEGFLRVLSLAKSLPCTVLRPSNPYGPRQNPFGKQGFVAIAIRKILVGEPIEIYGQEIAKDFFFVEDLARAVVLAAASRSKWSVYNVGSGVCTPLMQIIERIESTLSKKAVLRFVEGSRYDKPVTCLDIGKIREELAWEPRVTMDDGLQATCEYVVRVVQGRAD